MSLRIGDIAPDFTLVDNGLKTVTLQDTGNHVRIISVVPSLDTPVCDAQTKRFNEEASKLPDVDILTVSMDLPFAQARWQRAAKAKDMIFLSDYKTGEFGQSTGLLIAPLHLLTRTVIVTDKNGVIRYMQIVPEITELPDMDAAMAAAKALL